MAYAVPIRIPPALLALIDDKVARDKSNRSAVIIDALAGVFMGHDSEPERPAPKVRAPKPQVPADPRAALAQAESRVGVQPARVAALLNTSMVPVYDGSKRPAYQKGQQKVRK